jgi:hypothetical protein
VRSEGRDSAKARDGGQYVAVGSGELFLVYRGHVLILQRPNSLVSQAYRSGTHGNVPSTGESQSDCAPAFVIGARSSVAAGSQRAVCAGPGCR